jgi:predicted phosphodiesterase
MKLQIMSDLHLAFGEPIVPATDADLIVLAGDIGRPRESIRWAYGLGKPVLYVLGNHEYYGGVIGQVISEMRGLAAGSLIRVLDDDEVTIDGVRFLGCTMWTDLSLFGDGPERELAVRAAWQYMRDFSLIRTQEKKLFAPEDMAARFRQHLAWLEKRLGETSDLPTVVITHHAPSRRSIHPSFDGAPINAAYIVDLERLFGAERVRLWIHGHTHSSFDYTARGTRVVCNPRGYALNGIDQNRAFDAGFVVEV